MFVRVGTGTEGWTWVTGLDTWEVVLGLGVLGVVTGGVAEVPVCGRDGEATSFGFFGLKDT